MSEGCYFCPYCKGTFDHFKVPGQCPLCGRWAQVRCMACGYTADANVFVANRNRCPRCGKRVIIPGGDSAGRSCLACLGCSLALAVVGWLFGALLAFGSKHAPPAEPTATIQAGRSANGQAVVPLGEVAEWLGGSLSVDGSKVHLLTGGREVIGVFTVGSQAAEVHPLAPPPALEPFTLSGPVVVLDGKPCAPLRSLAVALHLEVSGDPSAGVLRLQAPTGEVAQVDLPR